MNTIEEAIDHIIENYDFKVAICAKISDIEGLRAEAKSALTALFKNGQVEARLDELEEQMKHKLLHQWDVSGNSSGKYRQLEWLNPITIANRITELKTSLKEEQPDEL